MHWSRFNYTHVIFQSWQIHICIHPSYVLNYFSHHVSLLLHHGATNAEMGVIEDFEQLMGRLRQSWAWPYNVAVEDPPLKNQNDFRMVCLAKALGRLHYRQYLRTLEDGFLFWIVCTVHQSEYLGCISWFGILTHLTIFSCLNLGQLCLSCRATLSWYCCVRQKVLSHFYSLGVSTCRTVTEFLRSWNVWSWLTVTLIG